MHFRHRETQPFRAFCSESGVAEQKGGKGPSSARMKEARRDELAVSQNGDRSSSRLKTERESHRSRVCNAEYNASLFMTRARARTRTRRVVSHRIVSYRAIEIVNTIPLYSSRTATDSGKRGGKKKEEARSRNDHDLRQVRGRGRRREREGGERMARSPAPGPRRTHACARAKRNSYVNWFNCSIVAGIKFPAACVAFTAVPMNCQWRYNRARLRRPERV